MAEPAQARFRSAAPAGKQPGRQEARGGRDCQQAQRRWNDANRQAADQRTGRRNLIVRQLQSRRGQDHDALLRCPAILLDSLSLLGGKQLGMVLGQWTESLGVVLAQVQRNRL